MIAKRKHQNIIILNTLLRKIRVLVDRPLSNVTRDSNIGIKHLSLCFSSIRNLIRIVYFVGTKQTSPEKRGIYTLGIHRKTVGLFNIIFHRQSRPPTATLCCYRYREGILWHKFDKDSSLLLHDIHGLFYWRILQKTTPYKKSAKQENLSPSWRAFEESKTRVENQTKNWEDSSLCSETLTKNAVQEFYLDS